LPQSLRSFAMTCGRVWVVGIESRWARIFDIDYLTGYGDWGILWDKGRRKISVKVVDIFGNDGMKIIEVIIRGHR